MRFDDNLFVSGTGLHLAPALDMQAAQDAGLCERKMVWRTGMRSVSVSDGESGPELAVHAARDAVQASGAAPDDIDLVLYASTYHQGHDLWAAASYVQHQAVGNGCLSMEVRQLSNGGLAATELAAGYLLADPGRHSALIATGDRFATPGFDRFATDPGTICGDGGSAMVLSRRGGFARMLSLVTVSDPSLELMGRGEDPFSAAPLEARAPIGIDAHRAHLIREIGMTELLERLRRGQQESFALALKESGRSADEVRWFVLPNLGRPKMNVQFFEPLDIDPARTTHEWGLGVGHLGAGDQIAGLGHLVQDGSLAPGDVCVLIGAGGGFAWSTAVLEIV